VVIRVGLVDCLECCCGQRVGLADRLEQLWSKSWSGRLSRALVVIELVWQIVQSSCSHTVGLADRLEQLWL